MEVLDGRAGAEHILVAVGAVYAPDRRPVLAVAEPGHTEEGLLPGIRAVPILLGYGIGGVRGASQRAVLD